jgi:hypothetical protein
MTEMENELFEAVEKARSFMMGMSFDPALPDHAKEALMHKAGELDKLTDKYSDRT